MRSLFLLTLLGVLLAFPAFAQDETETPVTPLVPTEVLSPTPSPIPPTPMPTVTPLPEVEDFIFNWFEESIFPEVVIFNLTVDRPINQISNLSILMRPEGQPERTITVDVQDNAIREAETFTDFEFLWEVPPGNPLPLGGLVEYNWLVSLTDGQSAEVPGVFAYQNPEISWTIDEDPDGWLNLIYPTGTVSASGLRLSTEAMYNQLILNTGRELQFRLALVNDDFPFTPCRPNDDEVLVVYGLRSNVEVECDDDMTDAILRDLSYEAFPVPGYTVSNMQVPIWTYMVESFYETEWVNSDIPAWFRSGITSFYQPIGKVGLLETMRNAFRVGQDFPLEAMNAPANEDDSVYTAQSYIMVLYIAERAGVDAVFALANPIDPDDSDEDIPTTFEERYESLMGQPLQSLLPAIENWVFSNGAGSAAALDIYGGSTPVPSPTNTVTPFPPSPTATATATATITNTPTATGFLSATPLPTLTPSITVTSPPPTITPRPARSFSDLTPEPPASPQDNADETDTQTLLQYGVVGIFGLLILLIVFALLRGRQ